MTFVSPVASAPATRSVTLYFSSISFALQKALKVFCFTFSTTCRLREASTGGARALA